MEWIRFILPLLMGVGLGILYFGGLWFTVQKINTVIYPALWMISSFFIRIGMLLITFYWLLMINWSFLAVGFIGFLLARSVFTQQFKQVKKFSVEEEYGI
ncbi:MAG: ATP synthase subunit I [Gracilimonas sp.]|uniref:ATP synthase subunit I n=1 Tax=Gracilimonas sp. TaxID=1974203 RepID=UPI0019CDED8C|nr:ATP synthase subunit I [Gracilimonas sp.]MBD3616309.1 ATP synthase subunit I [Gracilimonas sp.]